MQVSLLVSSMVKLANFVICGDTVFLLNRWETAGIITKARKKHQKRSKYLDCESNLYHCPIIVFTMDITVNLQTESRESVRMPVLLMPVYHNKICGEFTSSSYLIFRCARENSIFCKCPVHRAFESLSPCATVQSQDSIL